MPMLMGLLGGGADVVGRRSASTSRLSSSQLHGAITEWTLWVGVIKAPFFAAIIALVGCYEGLQRHRAAPKASAG